MVSGPNPAGRLRVLPDGPLRRPLARHPDHRPRRLSLSGPLHRGQFRKDQVRRDEHRLRVAIVLVRRRPECRKVSRGVSRRAPLARRRHRCHDRRDVRWCPRRRGLDQFRKPARGRGPVQARTLAWAHGAARARSLVRGHTPA